MSSDTRADYDAATARAELVEYGRKIDARGLVVGPGGNTSIRAGDVVYIKASGIAMETATEEDYIGVDLRTGDVVDGKLRPSCEIPMHLGCYLAREDVGAVCHTHPPLATAVATTGKTIPAMFPDFVAYLGKAIAWIGYVPPAGPVMARAVTDALPDHNAVLLSNHGLVTVGSNMKEAYYRTLVAEAAAKTYIASLIVGEPRLLTPEEIDGINNMGAEDYRRALLRGELLS